MSHKFIPLSVPNLKGNELKYITQAVETEWVSTAGPFVTDFENKIAAYVKCKGAVSCQNGTSGLHIALQICGIKKDEEVIVPALTFIATVNPVKYIGAEPVFLDCDDSLNVDPEKLSDFCKYECSFNNGTLINNKTGKPIISLIIVHIFGNMADMDKIMDISHKYNLKVIEDATEAIGTYYTEGRYKGKFAGTIGTVGVYSFNGNKIITTGGGGMIVSDDETLLKEAKHLTTQAKSDELYYIHDEIGYNYRMTNLQAALGIAQLEQLEGFIDTKRDNYEMYKKGIADIPGLSLLSFKDDCRSNYWFYALLLDHKYLLNRDELIKYLSANKIQSRPIWALINEQKPYIKNESYKIAKAKTYVNNVVNLPCSTNLHKDDISYILECLRDPYKV